MRYLFEAAAVILAGYYFYTLLIQFMASTKTTLMDRVIDAGQGSMTIFTARLASVVTTLMLVLPDVSAVFGVEGVQEAVRGIIPTGAVPYYIIGLNVLTELARRRTL